MVSKITDKILPQVKEWQSRPLAPIYPFVFMDCIHYKVLLYNGMSTLDVYLDISFLKKESDDDNTGKLLKVKMTGRNILKALNSVDMKEERFPDAYFTASGLRIIFAPWAGAGKRCVSVTMSDGKALDLEKEYTVALWAGAVNEELIESIVEVYDVRAADLLKERIEEKGGVIEPENKDFILDWKTR